MRLTIDVPTTDITESLNKIIDTLKYILLSKYEIFITVI